MPTIECSYDDLQSLIGRHVPLEELEEKAILYAKGEVEGIDGEKLKLDIKDANRPDLWSVEGIAREIAGRYGKPGLPSFDVSKGELKVVVDPKVKKVRPYTVCAVVRGLHIDEIVLSQMIQLQEKVADTYGRKRREVAIGVYDFNKIRGPIRYTTTKPEGTKFVPLDFKKPMTPKQILSQHPKGKEYAHLLEGQPEYPIFIDSAGEVLSMPPVINSDYTGKVTSETSDVFIECSGHSLKFLVPALNVLVAALSDRGGKIEGVEVSYPAGYEKRKIVTPELAPGKIKMDPEDVHRLLGEELTEKEVMALLAKARHGARKTGKLIEVSYPAYRQDIMHWRDIAEDVIISRGYNEIDPKPPTIPTTGSEDGKFSASRRIAGLMAGMGLQEVSSYMLTSKRNMFTNMMLKEGPIVELENYMSINWSVLRTWLLPGLLEFLSKNKHVEYPQKVFEIGNIVVPDAAKKETMTSDERKMAYAMSSNTAGYEDASGILEALMASLGREYELKPISHPSFIPGRCASITVGGKEMGFIGEVHPAVLNNWGLEKPVAGFEIGLDAILDKL